MADPIEVLLKFAFIAVLYLFLLWVARSSLKDLRRPVPQDGEHFEADLSVGGPRGNGLSPSKLVAEHGGGLRVGQVFVVGSGLVIGRAGGIEAQIEDNIGSGRPPR